MKRLIGLTVLLMGFTGYALAGAPAAPEIDASSGAAAVALLAGGLLVLRARRARK
jgi:hypothetical protein